MEIYQWPSICGIVQDGLDGNLKAKTLKKKRQRQNQQQLKFYVLVTKNCLPDDVDGFGKDTTITGNSRTMRDLTMIALDPENNVERLSVS